MTTIALALLMAAGIPPNAATSPHVAMEVKMPPAGWSKYGWQNLRWGMGPADLVSRVTWASPPEFSLDSKGFPSILGLNSKADQILGLQVLIQATFSKENRLASLLVVPMAPGINASRCEAWTADLRRLLDEKYLPNPQLDCTTGTCGWVGREDNGKSAFVVLVRKVRANPGQCAVALSYFDPRFMEAVGQKVHEAIQVEKDKL